MSDITLDQAKARLARREEEIRESQDKQCSPVGGQEAQERIEQLKRSLSAQAQNSQALAERVQELERENLDLERENEELRCELDQILQTNENIMSGWMQDVDRFQGKIAGLEAERDRIRLEREQLRAANSVHMQTLAMIAKGAHLGCLTFEENASETYAQERMRAADDAAQRVRLEDCVIARINNDR